MVKIEINPARIERVVIEAQYEVEREFDAATFILIQPHLRRINQDLKRLHKSRSACPPKRVG